MPTTTLPIQRAVAVLLLLIVTLSVSARKLTGRVVDDATGRTIPNATVELLSIEDSSVVATAIMKSDTTWSNDIYSYYNIENVQNNTEYILRASAIGYETAYKRVKVRMGERVAQQWLGDIKLKENTTMLDELVVKATKIKMVTKGDTIVYDATAFQLSEGSMLDALIRQLPGATLENGVIKINGRQVSSLLIDGRDFFNGDAKKALQNLPAYTVDKVKAYEKAGRQSRLMGVDTGDKQFVLDVNLKKQYHQGMIGNVDLAAGSNNRYSGRAFAMGYTKKDRLTLTGQTNNINDSSVPGEGDYSVEPSTQSGKTATKMASFDYRHEGKTEDDYVSATGSYNYSDNEYRSRTTTQNYLEGGDTYGLNKTQSRTKSRLYQLSAAFSIHPKGLIVNGSSSFSFSQNHAFSQSLSGSFNGNPSWAGDLLDSLFLPSASQRLMKMAVNRVRNESRSNGQQLSWAGNVAMVKSFGKTEEGWQNSMSANVSTNYSHGKNRNFAINQIDYLTTGAEDHRNQYTDAPYNSFNFNGGTSYQHVFTLNRDSDVHLLPGISYAYRQSFDHSASSLYRLDQLADYVEKSYPLGLLPSSREALLNVLDATNSYRSDLWQNSHVFTPSLYYDGGNGTMRPALKVMLSTGIELKHEHLRYYRSRQYDRSRNAALVNGQLSVYYLNNDSTANRFLVASLSSSEMQPNLVQLLGIHDDSNPLQVSDGNAHLKNSRNYDVSAFFYAVFPQTQNSINGGAKWSVTRNAQATSVVYDKTTGITHSRPENINGNWDASIQATYDWHPLQKHKELGITLHGSTYYRHSVDLMQTAGTDRGRSTVDTWENSWRLGVGYSKGENSVNIFGGFSNQHVSGSREDFSTTNAWNNSLGLNATWRLPWHLQFSTDITNYIRRGYNDKAMNDNEWVWNARLTRLFLKDKLSVSIDGFDILGQLKTTQYTLNEQGRTEQWTNSLPRYLMLHVAYKLTLGMRRN